MIIEFHVPFDKKYEILNELHKHEEILILDNASAVAPLFLIRSGNNKKADPQVLAAEISAKINAKAIITAAIIQLIGTGISKDSAKTPPPLTPPIVIIIDNNTSINISSIEEIEQLPQVLENHNIANSKKVIIKSEE